MEARTAIGAGVALLAVGGALAVRYDFVPRMDGLDELPPTITGGDTLICPADTLDTCNRETALAYSSSDGRVEVTLDQVPGHLKGALIAAEDGDFLSHDGVDVGRTAMAVVRAIPRGHFTSGASTIDRQVAGIIYEPLTDEQLAECGAMADWAMTDWPLVGRPSDGMLTQLGEGCLAVTMNKFMSKDEILELYFNNAFFGRGATGIHAAAEVYYGVAVEDLTLEQSAGLIALLPAPSDMEQTSQNRESTLWQEEHEYWLENYSRVLNAMGREGLLSDEQIQEFIATPPDFIPYEQLPTGGRDLARDIRAEHVVDMARAEAATLVGVRPEALGGYTIHTTINVDHQRALSEAAATEPLIGQAGIDVAAVSLGPDNAITALLGSNDYGSRELNLATGREGGGSGRHAGSLNKMYLAAVALEAGYELDTEFTLPPDSTEELIIDAGSGCSRLERPEPCVMTFREALAVSSNLAAAMLVHELGADRVGELMQDLGVDIEPPFEEGIVLGTGETSVLGQTAGYSNLLLRGGQAAEPFLITRIINPNGNEIYNYESAEGNQVVDSDVSYDLIRAGNDVITYGTASSAIELPAGPLSASGKTGTSNDVADAYFAGSACVGGGFTLTLWMGNPDGRISMEPQGVTSVVPAGIWGEYMQRRMNPGEQCSLLPPDEVQEDEPAPTTTTTAPITTIVPTTPTPSTAPTTAPTTTVSVPTPTPSTTAPPLTVPATPSTTIAVAPPDTVPAPGGGPAFTIP